MKYQEASNWLSVQQAPRPVRLTGRQIIAPEDDSGCRSVFHQVQRAFEFQFEFGALGEIQFAAAA